MKRTEKNSKWNADAEMAMMGFVIEIQNEDHLHYLLNYTKEVLNRELDPEDVIEKSQRYLSGEFEYKHLSINETDFGLLYAITLVTEEDEEPYQLVNEYGTFSYVYNVDAPFCSELGYSFFQEENGRVKRVG